MRNSHRTLAAIAAASVGALLLAGCTTDTGTQAPEPTASTVSDSTEQATTDSVYIHADNEGQDGDERGPSLDSATVIEAVAVWDLELTFAAANATNGTDASTETIGDTEAMPDYEPALDEYGLVAA